MTGVNKHIIGHLGRDPRIVTTGAGRVATFSVATSEQWRDKETGERREATAWHQVAIFAEPLVEVAEKYLRKGSKVYLEGQVLAREYKDGGGERRFITETVLKAFRGVLVLLDKAESAPAPSEAAYTRASAVAPPFDDEIPF